jgi:hypothetical protein
VTAWASIAGGAILRCLATMRRAHEVDSRTHDLYTTGLLVGRAYALAHAPERGAVAELVELAADDAGALVAAEARLRGFAERSPDGHVERRAARLLNAALRLIDDAAAHATCCPAV